MTGDLDTGAGAGEMLAAALGGDDDAFQALVAPHLRALHLHSYRMLGSYSDAEEAVQEVLIRAWRGLPGYRVPDRCGTGCTGSPPPPASR
jgi:RNA polymerase sigma-70 factor (ECF subfamily)